jgi:hypothetical protein
MRWFRVYDDAVNDPKVQRLAPHLFKVWFNVLCLANKSGNGILPPVADIAFALRMSDCDAQSAVDELILVGLIDINADKTLAPHNWKSRQAPSDKSAERTKKWREGKKKKACDASQTVTVTARDETSDALEQNRIDKDNTLVPSDSVAAREKPKKLGFDLGSGKLKTMGKPKGAISTLTSRAEGLGLPVEEIEADVARAKPENQPAYFTGICVKRLQASHPNIPEQLIRDALWKRSSEAYTLVMAAMTEGVS